VSFVEEKSRSKNEAINSKKASGAPCGIMIPRTREDTGKKRSFIGIKERHEESSDVERHAGGSSHGEEGDHGRPTGGGKGDFL